MFSSSFNIKNILKAMLIPVALALTCLNHLHWAPDAIMIWAAVCREDSNTIDDLQVIYLLHSTCFTYDFWCVKTVVVVQMLGKIDVVGGTSGKAL